MTMFIGLSIQILHSFELPLSPAALAAEAVGEVVVAVVVVVEPVVEEVVDEDDEVSV
jgi:hypothetical protein